ncbi:uncharacterized protein ARMOST_11502 [Armillaria ostoyae]|uniref:Uncharacterized protein n=1 Tax=Armillaria ostoyae TaxID=47428 RepID=A0A284RHA3_ARMOS|nr:uncharacterized protein ARMOST_11502 [Armillaria ostoyae]
MLPARVVRTHHRQRRDCRRLSRLHLIHRSTSKSHREFYPFLLTSLLQNYEMQACQNISLRDSDRSSAEDRRAGRGNGFSRVLYGKVAGRAIKSTGDKTRRELSSTLVCVACSWAEKILCETRLSRPQRQPYY